MTFDHFWRYPRRMARWGSELGLSLYGQRAPSPIIPWLDAQTRVSHSSKSHHRGGSLLAGET